MSDINYEVPADLIVPDRAIGVIKSNRSIIGDVLSDVVQRKRIGCIVLCYDSKHTGLHLSHCERGYRGDS